MRVYRTYFYPDRCCTIYEFSISNLIYFAGFGTCQPVSQLQIFWGLQSVNPHPLMSMEGVYGLEQQVGERRATNLIQPALTSHATDRSMALCGSWCLFRRSQGRNLLSTQLMIFHRTDLSRFVPMTCRVPTKAAHYFTDGIAPIHDNKTARRLDGTCFQLCELTRGCTWRQKCLGRSNRYLTCKR